MVLCQKWLLTNVSNKLALMSSVREKSIERHVQSEDISVILTARYLTCQHVVLKSLPDCNPQVWDKLLKNEFGDSKSGKNSSFSKAV